MSVRSFDKIVDSPDQLKMSALLRLVRNSLAEHRYGEYICNVAREVGEQMGLDGFVVRHRVGNFLVANGVGIGGDWFRRRTEAAHRLFPATYAPAGG